MVKRGIGALVLAIIAALLLGWLLKDKSQERQEVMEIKLPNAPEMNIPSLSDTVSNVSDSAASLVGEATDKVTDAGNSVVAAATGTVSSIKDNVSNAVNTATTTTTDAATQVANGKPGFSIRPSQQNEEKEIVDNTKSGLALITSSETESESDTKAPVNNTVIASTKTKAKKKVEKFKPRLVEKKKPAKKMAKQEPKKAAKPKKETKDIAKNTPVEKPTPTAAVATGKYSIQLLATSSQSRANKLAKTMTGEGYKAFITQTTNNNKILYRVRIGGHADRNAAIKAQEGMKRRYQKNFFVQNSLVISN